MFVAVVSKLNKLMLTNAIVKYHKFSLSEAKHQLIKSLFPTFCTSRTALMLQTII